MTPKTGFRVVAAATAAVATLAILHAVQPPAQLAQAPQRPSQNAANTQTSKPSAADTRPPAANPPPVGVSATIPNRPRDSRISENDTPPSVDPAAAAFSAELDGYVRDRREPEFIEAIASALARGDHSATTRWNIYVLRFIGTEKAESVLHDALSIEVRKGLPDLDDRLSVVASAFDALEDIVGREERIDMTARYVTALEDTIVNATVPHLAIHAARIHLTHAENREEAERHLAVLLGQERAWILDIDDRIPALLPEKP